MSLLAIDQIVAALAARVAVAPSLQIPLRAEPDDGVTPVDLPAAWLWSPSEEAQLSTLDGAHEYTADVVLRVLVADDGALGDAMSTVAAELLALLFAPPLPYDLTHTGSTRRIATRGSVRCGEVQIAARVTYYADPAQPGVLLST